MDGALRADRIFNQKENSMTNRTSKSTHIASSSARSALQSAKDFNIAGISLPEIAVLAAAGYVVFRNREKIGNFLNENGIEVPTFLTGDMSDLVQSGANLLAGKTDNERATRSSAKNRRSTSYASDFHDA